MGSSPLHISKYKGKKPDYRDEFTNKLIFFLALPLEVVTFFLIYDIPPARYFFLVGIMWMLFGLEIEHYPVWRTLAFIRERYHLRKFTIHQRLIYSLFRTRVKTGQVEQFETEAKNVIN